VSELLQNADDAGATQASVRIKDKVFVFDHNGEDFKEEHFASLCRFGYSNKRALHTIGFRGIGFKSTFSLGNEVQLNTPTLSVVFRRQRFSEPVWQDSHWRSEGRTRVQVPIGDPKREADAEKNLNEWLKNPLSLLFFKNIRKLQIGEQVVHWQKLRDGPAAGSDWMALNGEKGKLYLHVRSQPEAFPDEALAEIRQERMLSEDDEAEFPPAAVEIVLGIEGRLFVVLPTEVKTALPFACNAPFIQEPARIRIKEPSTSTTNEWLLKRAGRLAASTMLAWLARADLPVEERAKAYGLLSDVDREDSSFEGACAAITELELGSTLGDESDVLLTNDGRLTKEKQAVAIPQALQDVWPGDQAAALLDDRGRPALARAVAPSDRAKLVHWSMVEEFGKNELLSTLAKKHLPRPKTWRQLLVLWGYIAPEVTPYWTAFTPSSLRIVPVQGKDVLYAASEVVRLGEKKLLQSDEDWDFLAEFLLVLNPNWNRFLAEQRLEAEREKDAEALKVVTAAYGVLKKIGLDEVSDVSIVVDRVGAQLFAKREITIAECVRLAQIGAALGIAVGPSFRYVARDNTIRKASDGVIFDPIGEVEELIPLEGREARLLHGDYVAKFTSCTPQDWEKSVSSGRSGLLGFEPLASRRWRVYAIEEEARRRGVHTDLYFPYKPRDFIVEDWDFPDEAWRHWQASASEDEKIWGKVAQAILRQPDSFWSRATNARLLQVATTGREAEMTSDRALPSWALRLRELPCLPDTRGFLHKPRDLLRRTVATDAYRDVEPFIHPSLDSEARAPLLDLLGVRSTPIGPEQILERLRALAKASKPPVLEVEKWYQRLDQVVDSCSTADLQAIKHAFRTGKLILSEAGEWSTTTGIYLADDPAVPGAATIRGSVAHLSIWRKLDVEDRPTAERALRWLGELPSGEALSPDDARRVRALLPLHAANIWDECGHWLNLAGEWAPVQGLKYSMSMQSLVAWSNLYEPIKRQTADLQMLSAELATAPPFSRLPFLSGQIEERFQGDLFLSGPAEDPPWLRAFGDALRRVDLGDEAQTARVRSLAEQLSSTKWQLAPGLQVFPYIGGTPSGTPRRADVLWIERTLFVEQLSKPRLAKRVPEEIAKTFGRADIRDALSYSFERTPDDVIAYLEENFTLVPIHAVPPVPPGPDAILQPAPTEEPKTAAAPIAQEPASTASALNEDAAEKEPPSQQQMPEPQPPTLQRPRAPAKPPKPDLMQRFAATHGFARESEVRFFHANGAWIGRTSGMRFPWERRTANGDLVAYYWPQDRCIDHEALELEADVWTLLQEAPATYALLLADADGGAVELFGRKLAEMVASGAIKLYPASYRITAETKEPANTH
jgi:hypothetical protein